MTHTTLTIDDIDLSDHDAFVDGVPYEAFALLRSEDPVHFNAEPDGRGFWAVTRYEDIRAVHRDVQTFSSELGGTSLEDLDPEHVEARKSMIDMDPPRHDELRAIINKRFTPRAVQRVGGRRCAAWPTRCSIARSRWASSTSWRRSARRSRCRCSPRSWASRSTSAARSSSWATGCWATRIPSTPSSPTRPTGRCRSPAPSRWRCSSSAAGWPRRAGAIPRTTSSPSWPSRG